MADATGFLLRRRQQAETRFDRWLRTARNGVFGVLFTMAKDHSSHTKISIFGMGMCKWQSALGWRQRAPCRAGRLP